MSRLLPAAALTFNAFVWGVSWLPTRELLGRGLHPLWTTAIVFTVGTLVLLAWRPRSAARLLQAPTLWIVVLASGLTNAAFNWGVAIGEVVRVVLMFYLMPLWAVLLAWLILGERVSWLGWLRLALAVTGAMVVLAPADGVAFWRGIGAADLLGLSGGFTFALNNVLLRREAHRPQEVRALAMAVGGVLVPSLLALALMGQGLVPPLPPFDPVWVLLAVGLGLTFLLANFALQFGAARLPAQITAVVMITEVVFAAVSAVWLAGEALTLRTVLGGALIVCAAALSVVRSRNRAGAVAPG